MDDLIEVLIVFIGIGASLLASAAKSKKNKNTEARRQAAFPSRVQPAAKPAHPYTPATPAVLPPMVFADVPGQAITPTVHLHVEPDCKTHDQPGSLGVTSTEGKDPCHEEQLTQLRTFQEPAPEAPVLSLEWSGENMVKAFIMQEVLTRPCQRRAQ